MRVSSTQRLMAAVGWYSGLTDDDAGPKTWAGVARSEKTERRRYCDDPKHWSEKRRLTGAGQAALAVLGL